MKNYLLLVFVTCFVNYSFSQVCALSSDTAHMDVNNARVILQASGDLFWNRWDAGYFIPKEDNTSTVLVGGLWLGGVDAGGNLKIATQTYRSSAGLTDWWPGPLDLDNGTTTAPICNNFDHIWEIGRDEINAHIADFDNDGNIDGPVPQNIIAWPGRDNPESLAANGFELPEGRLLAPFTDRNGNGKYEPLQGDYPNVNGDQAFWWIFNDEGSGGEHGESYGAPVRAEVHALAYAFEGGNDEDLVNTTFYDFSIYNRSLEDLDSAYVSLWIDPQLGCEWDDYFGSIPTENMAFIYNADSLDGRVGCDCDGVPTFCDNLPMTGFKILQGPINIEGEDVGFSSFTYYNDYGSIIGEPPSGVTDPTYDLEYYRYMTGSWRDGTPFSYGYDGYFTLNSQPYPFAFDGNPSDTNQWSLLSETLPEYNRKMLINSGPFKLQPGQGTSISIASFTKLNVESADAGPILAMGKSIQGFYDNLTPTSSPVLRRNASHFYPNPLVSEGKLTIFDGIMQSVRIFNANGQVVRFYNGLKTDELVIARGGLPSGLYFYTALLDNGQLATGKIAIQ